MNNKFKILLIEDESHISHFVTALLESNEYKVVQADLGENGLMLFKSHNPDLVILDLGLPDMDGMDVLVEIRKEASTPVIVLSARLDEHDKVLALDYGANDYITKPFGSGEFMARVRSALRIAHHRAAQALLTGGKFELKDMIIDYDTRRVYVEGNEIKLTQTEYNIMALFSEHCGKVLTYSFIIKEIWGYNDIGSTKKLQVNMANIRKKLGAQPGKKNYIVNELGVGYRMCEPES